MAETRVSQLSAEVVAQGAASVQASQEIVEVVAQGTSFVRPSQLVAEVVVQVSVIATNVKNVTADALIGVAHTKDLTADGLVAGATVKNLLSDGLVKGDMTKETAASALVQITNDLELTSSALVTIAQPEDLSADATVEGEFSTQATGSGIVRATNNLELSGGGIVEVAPSVPVNVSAAGIVQDSFVKNLTGSGLVQTTRQSETTADAYIAQSVDASADGVVTATNNKQVIGSAQVQQTLTKDLTADSVTVIAGSLSFTGDATTISTPIQEVGAGGIVVGANLKELAASAFVSLALELSADAYITPTPEVEGDAIVTLNQGSARFLRWTDGVQSDISGYRLCASDLLSGTVFVDPSFTTSDPWIAEFSANVVAAGIEVDFATGAAAVFDLVLKQAGAEIGRATLAWADWHTGPTTGTGLILVPMTASLTQGLAYALTVELTSGVLPRLRATQITPSDWRLNHLVATDAVPSVLDGRPVIVAPLVGGARVFSLDAVASVDQLLIAPGASVTHDAAEFTVTENLLIQPGATLSAAGAHRLRLPGTTQVQGQLTLAGDPKERTAALVAATIPQSTTLSLDRAPDWLPSDQLYLCSASELEGAIVEILSVSGTHVALASATGRNLPVGALIINLTRSIELVGGTVTLSGAQSWSHVSLRGITVALRGGDDIVVSQTRPLNAATGGIGITELNGAANLTVVRAGTGLVLNGESAGGLTVIAGCLQGIDAQGVCGANVLAQDNKGCLVRLAGGARFSGDVDGRWVKPGGGLFEALGTVKEITGAMRMTSIASIETCAVQARGSVANWTGTLFSDAPAVFVRPGCRFVNGELSGQIQDPLVRFESDAFVRLITDAVRSDALPRDPLAIESAEDPGTWTEDEGPTREVAATGWVEIIPGIDVGAMLPGSVIAARNQTRTFYGTYEEDLQVAHAGMASERLTANGELFSWELARLAIDGTLTLSLFAKGEGTLVLEEQRVAISGDWSEYAISCSASKVVRLLAETGSTLWIDELRRR